MSTIHVDATGKSPQEVHNELRHVFAQNPDLLELIKTARIPRLFIWMPGLNDWVPPLVGSSWDAEYARAVYRARKVCTMWVKGHAA